MKQRVKEVSSGSRSAEFWRELVKEWEASGRSQRAVAEAAGVNAHTFQYWRAKLRTAGAAAASRPSKPTAFVEVAVSAPVRKEGTPCRVRVGDDVVLELSALPSPEWVRALRQRSC